MKAKSAQYLPQKWNGFLLQYPNLYCRCYNCDCYLRDDMYRTRLCLLMQVIQTVEDFETEIWEEKKIQISTKRIWIFARRIRIHLSEDSCKHLVLCEIVSIKFISFSSKRFILGQLRDSELKFIKIKILSIIFKKSISSQI